MNKKKTKKKVVKIASLAILGVMLFSTGVLAASKLLNWTGNQTMVDAGIFIEQVTNKLIKSEGEKKQAISDKDAANSEKEIIENEKNQLEEEIKKLEEEIEKLKEEVANKEEGWTEKDQQIIDLNNQLIEKQNDVDHLTRELQRANEAAEVIQVKLDVAKNKLDENEINIWN